MNDYGVLQECTDCSAVIIPQSYMKTVVCQVCPTSILKKQAESVDRSERYFIIKQGELKCEDCWLQVVFAERVKQVQAAHREAERSDAWELPEQYQYYCVSCTAVTSW